VQISLAALIAAMRARWTGMRGEERALLVSCVCRWHQHLDPLASPERGARASGREVTDTADTV
jgi:hypothetical protein